MTDERPTKDMWTRCPACSTVMPNIKIAKDGHKLNCPYDLQLKLKAQGERITELETQLKGVTGGLEEISSDPGIDLTGVASWDEDDDEVSPPLPGPVATSNWDDEEDEEEAPLPSGILP